MPNEQQAIIWTSTDPVHWCIHAALGGDELKIRWIMISVNEMKGKFCTPRKFSFLLKKLLVLYLQYLVHNILYLRPNNESVYKRLCDSSVLAGDYFSIFFTWWKILLVINQFMLSRLYSKFQTMTRQDKIVLEFGKEYNQIPTKGQGENESTLSWLTSEY